MKSLIKKLQGYRVTELQSDKGTRVTEGQSCRVTVSPLRRLLSSFLPQFTVHSSQSTVSRSLLTACCSLLLLLLPASAQITNRWQFTNDVQYRIDEPTRAMINTNPPGTAELVLQATTLNRTDLGDYDIATALSMLSVGADSHVRLSGGGEDLYANPPGIFTSRVLDGGTQNRWREIFARASGDQRVRSDGLVVYMRLDDDNWLNQVSGRSGKAYGIAFAATANSFLTSDSIAGPAAARFRYDGFVLGGDANVINGATALTVCCWVNLRSYRSYAGIVSSRSAPNPLQGLVLDAGSGVMNFYINSASVSGPMPLKQWTFLCGTWSSQGGQAKIYLNGIEVASAVLPASSLNSPGSIAIANDVSSATDRILDGDIDEVMVWTRAISTNEINSLYKMKYNQFATAKFQIRTAANTNALSSSDFVGADGTTNSFYAGGDLLVSSSSSVLTNRYLQYRAFLDGLADRKRTPFLASVALTGSKGTLIDSAQPHFAAGEATYGVTNAPEPDVPFIGLAKHWAGGFHTNAYFTSVALDAGNPVGWNSISWIVAPEIDNTLASLVGIWRLNNSWSSSKSPGAFSSATYGNAGFTDIAKLGTASARFDGIDSFADIAMATNFRSMSFWIACSAPYGGLFDVSLESNQHAIVVVSNMVVQVKPPMGHAVPAIFVNGSEGSSQLLSGWNHVALVFDQRLFASRLTVGLADGAYFHGLLDEMALYSQPLSLAEISSDFATQKREVAGKVRAQVRAGNALPLTNNFTGSYGSGAILSASGRYLQYRLILEGDGSGTPLVRAVGVANDDNTLTDTLSSDFLPGDFDGGKAAMYGAELTLAPMLNWNTLNMDSVDPVYANGLVGLWHMDEDTWAEGAILRDSAGSSDGAPGGNARPVYQPRVGIACGLFRGGADHVVIPGADLAADFTVSFWFKTYATNRSALFSTYNLSRGYYTFEINGDGSSRAPGRLAFTIKGNGAYPAKTAVADRMGLNDNKWHHVAGVRSGSQIWLVIDGTRAGFSDIGLAYGSVGNEQGTLARMGSDTNFPCDGFFDELAIWNRGLSDGEIGDVYQGGYKTYGTGIYQSDVLDSGLPSIWERLAWVPDAPCGPVVQDGSVAALWRMESAANPVTNTFGANPGTASANVIFSQAGRFGYSLKFNGVDTTVQVPDAATLQVSPFSVEAWVNPLMCDARTVVSKVQGNSGYVVGMDANSLPYLWIGDGGGGGTTITGYQPARVGKWSHVAATYDTTGDLKLYVDGTVVASGRQAGLSPVAFTDLHIGSRSGGSDFFRGSIDEVAVYNKALKSFEVFDHYQAGAVTLKFQCRVTNNVSFTGVPFTGPDKTTNTFFTTFSGENLLGLLPQGQYFQFKAYFGTEDFRITPRLRGVQVDASSYPSDNPTVEPTTAASSNFLGNLLGFVHVVQNTNTTAVRYQISGDSNDSPRWFYWGGSQWVQESGGGYGSQANTSNEVNQYIGSFYTQLYDKVGGQFRFRAFLHSGGSDAVKLDRVDLKASAGRLVLIEPDTWNRGKDAWIVGITNSIRWNSAGLVHDNLTIEFSNNGGNSWQTIATGESNDGLYEWLTPGNQQNDTNNNCMVRITDVTDPTIWDGSDQVFELAYRFHLLAPNGGEKWYTGETNLIVWASAPGLGANISIHGSGNSGTNWNELVESSPSVVGITNNAYALVLPKTNASILSQAARLGIAPEGLNQSAAFFDGSDANFTIAGIRITRPVLGQEFKRGDEEVVEWTASGAGSAVRIELSIDGGVNFTEVVTNSTACVAGTNSMLWTVASSNPSPVVVLRARSISDPRVWGESAIFAIADIKIVNPAFDDKWKIGSTNLIKWTAGNAGDYVSIYYSIDDFATTNVISSRVGNDEYPLTNSFEWVVPADPSQNAKIKIAKYADVGQPETLAAISPRFNIAGIRIDAPDRTNHIWRLNNPDKIFWRYAAAGAAASADIYFSYDGDTNYVLIRSNYGLISTNFTYTPTNRPTQKGRAKIVVPDPSLTNFFDISDNDIEVAGVMVIAPTNKAVYTCGVRTDAAIAWYAAGKLSGARDVADIYYSPFSTNYSLLYAGTPCKLDYPGDNAVDWSAAGTADLEPSEAGKFKIVSGTYTGYSTNFVARGIKFTRPVLGTIVDLGPSNKLQWIKAGIASNSLARFYVSTDGGATFTNDIIGVDVPVGSVTSFDWAVSIDLKPVTNAFVRAQIVSSAKPEDVGYTSRSKAFMLRGLKMLVPQDAAVYDLGSTGIITFASAGMGSLASIYYASDGTNFDMAYPVVNGLPIRDGDNTYVWNIERDRVPSAAARLKVVSGSYEAISPLFTLRGILVTKPVNTDIWVVDDTNRIEWISVGTLNSYTVEVLKNGVPVSTAPATGNTFDWAVLSAASGTGVVARVSENGGVNAYGLSAPFEVVTNAVIRIVGPADGEYWKIRTEYDIVWARGGSMAETFDVFLLQNDAIVSNITGTIRVTNNIYRLAWSNNVADQLGTYQFLVTNTSYSGVYDRSGDFYLAPKFDVQFPNSGEGLYALKTYPVKWYEEGSVSNVDLYYTTEASPTPAGWVKINSTPIPVAGDKQAPTYNWQVPDIWTNTMWLRVQDHTYATNRYSRNVAGPYDDCNMSFTSQYYRIVWTVVDETYSTNLDNLSVVDSSGWSESNLKSPVVHYYPFGYWDTVWYREFFHNAVVFRWNPDEGENRTVVMDRSKVEPDYHVLADFIYDPTSTVFTVSSWIERTGAILTDPNSCSTTIYLQDGRAITNMVSDLHDSNGVFWQQWNVAASEAAMSTNFTSTELFFAKVMIRYSGVDYSAGVTFTLRLSATEQGFIDLMEQLANAESNIVDRVDNVNTNLMGVSNVLSGVASNTDYIRGQMGGLASNMVDVTNAISGMTNAMVDMTNSIAQMTNALLPGMDYLTNAVGDWILPSLSNINVNVSNLIAMEESDLARILTRPTTVMYGSTNVIMYKTRSGFGAGTVNMTIANASQGQVFTAAMSEVSPGLGIYEQTAVADWGTNSYTITCSDPNARDRMTLEVVGEGNVSLMLKAMSNRLDTIDTNLSSVLSIVQAIPTDLTTRLDGIDTDLGTLRAQLVNVAEYLVSISNSVTNVASGGISVDLSGVTTMMSNTLDAVTNQVFGGVVNVSTALARVESSITNSAMNISSTVERVGVQTTNAMMPTLAGLTSNLTTVGDNVTNILTGVEGIRGVDFPALAQGISNSSSVVTSSLITAMSSVSGAVGRVESTIDNTVVPALTGMSNTLVTVNQGVTNIEAGVEGIRTVDFPSLQSGVSNVNAAIGGLESAGLANLQDSLDALQGTVNALPTTDLSGLQTGLEGLDAAISGVGSMVQNIDLSALYRIESGLGSSTDTSSESFYNKLSEIQQQLGSTGSGAEQQAASAKTAAGAAATAVQALKAEIDKGNLPGALQILAKLTQDLQAARENIEAIPKLIEVDQFSKELREAVDAINEVAEKEGFKKLIEGGTVPPDGGGQSGAPEEEIKALKAQLEDAMSSMLLMKQMVDQKLNEPVVTDMLRAVE